MFGRQKTSRKMRGSATEAKGRIGTGPSCSVLSWMKWEIMLMFHTEEGNNLIYVLKRSLTIEGQEDKSGGVFLKNFK